MKIKRSFFFAANILSCYYMMEYLPHGVFGIDFDFKLDKRCNTPDENENG